MTHKLIKTDNYLLVVDDSGIEVGDYYWNKEYPSQVYKRHHYNTFSDYKKIIAHLPLNGSPILEGVDLLPPYSRYQEDGIEELAEINYPIGDWTEEQCLVRRLAFKTGYNKAREKYKYTEEDVRKAITMARDLEDWQDLVWEYEYDDIIQSLHQYPTEFECEMIPCNPIKYTTEDHLDVEPKTITTAQGIQWVGKYK